ncbi:MAG TPA: Gfo/Idh/MocA family oxidoreductase [Bryobacteraceae bacterium]|nr:Gfo/Idh/MocA family oxidoreductase [Bryobacteraceae bacterium]
MADSFLKGVMIGAGFFAGFQAEAWKRIAGVELVAVADPLRGRAEAFAAEFGIPRSYTDAGTMLQSERADFADIVTRPDSHRELCALAARHCRAVLCQKPMAPTWADCQAMVEDCAYNGARLLIHENWRWQPWYREAKRLIAEGRLGRVFHLGFRMRTGDGRGDTPYLVQPYFREMPRLLLYETVVHFLDTFRFLGGDLESVFCQTNRINSAIQGEDYALVQVSFASGANGVIDANRISGTSPPEVAFGEFRIEGEQAMLRIAPDGSLYLADYGKSEILCPLQIPCEGYKGDSVRALQQHFAACLRSGEAAESEGADYLKSVRAVEACYRSAETGMPVRLG